ncbi:MAG TPA: FHA domain-containing protein [Tepidiformaceae bacterium]|nr:FHA domain-containing protein [Tepidiformaceae bacterium]
MSTPDELLVLRLALLGILFAFVLVAAVILRSEGRPRTGRGPAPAPAIARLVVTAPAGSGLGRGAEFVIAGEMSIGRDPRNAIVVPDPSISSLHATVTRAGSTWRLVDHGSTNGSTVGGRPVDTRGVAIRIGDEVVLGAVRFRFEA